MSNASEQSAVVARVNKPFTFARKRGGFSAEFFPGAGSSIHYANRDVDTFTARKLPAGLLQAGDEVVVKYNDDVVFSGEVSRIVDRYGRGDDRTQDVTVSGPWDALCRLVFRQSWQKKSKNAQGQVTTATFLSSRVVLGQLPSGSPQHMKAQLGEIVGYAATPCGVSMDRNDAPALYLPFDEARDITCADAIRRELRFFPKLVVRFDYSQTTPKLQVVDPGETDASYVATVPKAERIYTYDAHPVSCVDVVVDATDVIVGGQSATYHQIYPANGDPDDLDCLHVTVQLERGSASTTSESFKSVTEDIPGESEDPDVPSSLNDVGWWRMKHPRLANVAANAITISNAARTPNNYPRIAKSTRGEIENAGLHCEVSRFTCKCKIQTADDEEDEIQLSMDFLTTDARTRTYTWQTGSESVAGETLPDGLAKALYEQRAGSLVSEQMTVRLGDSLPKLGDSADGLILQSVDVDVYDLTAQLSFGRPEHLSAEDMRSLLNGFRQRGYASTAKLREKAADEEAEEEDAPGGIPPIASSEWAPGVKAKATLKKTAQGANAGAIKLDAAAVPAGSTMQVKTLTVGSGSSAQTVHVLATDNVSVAGGGSSEFVHQFKLKKFPPSGVGSYVGIWFSGGANKLMVNGTYVDVENNQGLTNIQGENNYRRMNLGSSTDNSVNVYLNITKGTDGYEASYSTTSSSTAKWSILIGTVWNSGTVWQYVVGAMILNSTVTSDDGDTNVEDVDVVTNVDYSESTHKMTQTKKTVTVLAAADPQNPTSDVFEATAHSKEHS